MTRTEALALAAEQGTTVVHLKVRHDYTTRIDRTSSWGNPFVLHSPSDPRARAACLLAYVRGLELDTIRAAGRLRGEVLGCWCAPRLCHGDVLATLAAVDTVEERCALLAEWDRYLEAQHG